MFNSQKILRFFLLRVRCRLFCLGLLFSVDSGFGGEAILVASQRHSMITHGQLGMAFHLQSQLFDELPEKVDVHVTAKLLQDKPIAQVATIQNVSQGGTNLIVIAMTEIEKP